MVTRIVIIGGGPAGYEAALVAAGRGPDVAQVTVIDSDGIGGACVLWDCVPSKTFIASTGVRTELRRANGLGFDIKIEDAKISLPQIHNRVKTLARSQSADIGSNLLREVLAAARGDECSLIAGGPAADDHDAGRHGPNLVCWARCPPNNKFPRSLRYLPSELFDDPLGLPPCRSTPPTDRTCIQSRCCSAHRIRQWRVRVGCSGGD
ncbi:MAG: flavoprotein disulfide reductase [Mycobacterium sp.]|nr:flavoprotein disulfide reductase [Mycobacterium sp.]